MKKLLMLVALVGGLSLFASTKTAEAGYGYGGGYGGGFGGGYRTGFQGGYGGYRGYNNWNQGFRYNDYNYGGCHSGACYRPTYAPVYAPVYGGCGY